MIRRFCQHCVDGLFSAMAEWQPAHLRAGLLVLAAMVTGLLFALFRPQLHTFEEFAGGIAWRLNADATPEERINIIAIDEKSIEQLGAWPWPRETMARLVDALAASGAQLQLLDIVFPEAREGDERLLAAMQATRAVISQVPDIQAGQDIAAGLLTHPLSGVACEQNGIPATTSFVANNPGFAAVPKGHISALLDADGAVRKVPALVCVQGAAYPALSLSGLLVATGSDRWGASLQAGNGFLAPARQLELDGYPGLVVPLDAEGRMRVSFRKDPSAYRAYSAVDVINGTVDRAALENTWVLIGYTAFGLVDIVPTPFERAAPGVELQARILGSLLDAAIPYTPANSTLLLSLLGFAFAGLLFLLTRKRETSVVALLVGCGLLLPLLPLALHVQLLAVANIWLGWLAPSLYAVLAVSLLVLNEYARVKLERGRVLNNLSSYLPADAAREIAYTLPNSSISARRQNVTLLSADLRNFSAYTESRPPEESAALLHYFFVRAAEIIEAQGGQIQEFKGDAVMALWPANDQGAAKAALLAACAMQDAMDDVLPRNPPAGLEPLALGIGIEQGPVLVGSIGPAHRRSHTVLGETVTIALRIQGMTMDLAQPILIGECAARQLMDEQLQSQGSFLLDGLQRPHTLFAPPGVDAAARATADGPSLKLVLGGRS